MKDLENEENFTKFLLLLSGLVSEELGQELIFLSYLVWEKYLEESQIIVFPSCPNVSERIKEKIVKDF